jgi:RNA polymerase sigma factor (sigma-70 family)
MATGQLHTVLRHIRRLALAPGTTDLTDPQLLQRFAVHQEEDAFAALMGRHGQLVWGVCRHVLRHDHDAEDAFQATFLVLARHAASIRKQEALASWLHGTAYRVALRARRDAAIRRTHESRGKSMPPEKPFPESVLREALAILDEEVQRLSARQRAVFVLCSLEGKSLAEAAQQLGWKPGTVSGTLARARRQLERRLTRRGVTLTAVLSAVFLGRQAVPAAVPARLTQTTTQAALLYAAGKPAAAVVSSPVAAALAEGVTKTMFLTKLKTALVMLLAIAFVAGAGWLTCQTLAAKQPAPAKPEAANPAAKNPKPQAARDKADETVQVAGQVLDAGGKPCVGAKLYVWASGSKKVTEQAARATTDKDGRFRLRVSKAELARQAQIVVLADGQGPDWLDLSKVNKGNVTLRLVKDDMPIDGRVLDLEGQPVAGVTVEIGRLEHGDLKGWFAMRQKGWSGNLLQKELAPEALPGSTKITTDKDGRVRLTGLGRDRVALLRLSGDNIEHCVFWVVTRNDELGGFRRGPFGTYGAKFTHFARPSKPIIGTVRDKVTRKPLAGISIWSSYYNNRFATTDAHGRYRIVGAGKYERYSVSAGGPPYFNCTKMDIPDTAGVEPLVVDFDLERGIAVKGRLIDTSTGKPVWGRVSYVPMADNPNLKNYTELGKLQAIASDSGRAKADGAFTVVAIPGPGLLVARADDENRFPAAANKGFKIATNLILDGYHAIIPINPSEGEPKSTTRDIALAPGRTLTGTVVGPDGQPLAGAHFGGLSSLPQFTFGRDLSKMATASFTVGGLKPNKARPLFFLHPEKKLSRLMILRGDEKGPITVRLEPLGALTGRLLADDGKPLAGVRVKLALSYLPEDLKDVPKDIQFDFPAWSKLIGGEVLTDKDGTFQVKGLVPGVKYLLNVQRRMEQLTAYTRGHLAVESGKTTRLGDLRPPAGKGGKN